ncbi:MAG: hypothetical protein JSR31_14570 [Nitrospira sp.]|nr:hypothetical protein [Nitrospira sp.]
MQIQRAETKGSEYHPDLRFPRGAGTGLQITVLIAAEEIPEEETRTPAGYVARLR